MINLRFHSDSSLLPSLIFTGEVQKHRCKQKFT